MTYYGISKRIYNFNFILALEFCIIATFEPYILHETFWRTTDTIVTLKSVRTATEFRPGTTRKPRLAAGRRPMQAPELRAERATRSAARPSTAASRAFQSTPRLAADPPAVGGTERGRALDEPRRRKHRKPKAEERSEPRESRARGLSKSTQSLPSNQDLPSSHNKCRHKSTKRVSWDTNTRQ